ncbi:hypothetical protein L484_009709 [Morus notabilis]|uniref:Uncharacterized protein n=1 Tax=Morus notabilis TaxID=981085 RepID=W9SUJ8_9ROSA|nr:uncharacterized protein LOC21393029 [Morus notabilis]EXC27685.1 hypothetical protein L484_009709 [Morus notabilis]
MADQQLIQKQDVIQQNPLESPPQYSTEPPDFSVLRLDPHSSPCANCGFSGAGAGNGNPLKRPSPTSTDSQQPKPKKLILDDSTTTTAYPLLRCTISGPPSLAPDSGSGLSISSNASPSAKTTPNSDSTTPRSAAALPPRPPPLRRSISAPIPIPSPEKSLSRTSSSNVFDQTDISKNLTKIRNCWKVINMWMEEFVGVEHESDDQTESLRSEEENGVVETTTYHSNDKEINPAKGTERELEESLSVERNGNYLNIHFKCQCEKGYHFLLVDGSCFYKLM